MPAASLPTLADDTIAVQVDPARGGAIVALAIGGVRTGLVDQGDQTGREIQASLYNGQWGPGCWPCNAVCVWGWNPVQAGNACEQPSGGSLVSQSPTVLVTTTTPKQWNSTLGTANVTLQQTLTLVARGVIKIDYQVTNHEAFEIGADNWHELPLVALNASMTVGAYLSATGPTTTTTTLSVFTTAAPWVALSDVNGWTVLVYVPEHLTPWTIGFNASSTPNAWIQAWQWLQLAPGETGTDSAWLIVGRTLAEAQSRLQMLGA